MPAMMICGGSNFHPSWASRGWSMSYFYRLLVVITLFKSITMFFGTDSIIWNILLLGRNVGNIR